MQGISIATSAQNYRIMEKRCVVKIAVSSETDYYHIDDVVYCRSGMSPDFIERWQWFFEYLAARIKVANSRRKVEFYKGLQEIKLGRERHEYRRGVMMKSRTTKLKQLEKGVVDDDLFHFKSEDNERKKAEVKAQLESLERDEFTIPEFPEYINKMKEYL